LIKILNFVVRYAVYDIRWDQLAVGGWSEQTALLVVSGKIPQSSHSALLLEFLGDGGHLLAWCCESHPFGPSDSNVSFNTAKEHERQAVTHGPANLATPSLFIAKKTWKPLPNPSNLGPPPGFQKLLETNDSEGCSRPLTVSTYGTIKGTNEIVLVLMDGGALGGKAILSQVEYRVLMLFIHTNTHIIQGIKTNCLITDSI